MDIKSRFDLTKIFSEVDDFYRSFEKHCHLSALRSTRNESAGRKGGTGFMQHMNNHLFCVCLPISALELPDGSVPNTVRLSPPAPYPP